MSVLFWSLWNAVCPTLTLIRTVTSRPWCEALPHHGRTFSVYFSPLSFWLTLPRGVLSTHWCCPSRSCVVFLACVHLALFLALSLSPCNSFVSQWCDHSMLASLLWQCLTVPSCLFTPALLRTNSFVFFAVHETRSIFLSPFISKALRRVASFFLRVQLSKLSQPYVATGHTIAFISCIFVDIGTLWPFHIFCSDAPIAYPLFILVQNSVVHSPSSVIRDPRKVQEYIHLYREIWTWGFWDNILCESTGTQIRCSLYFTPLSKAK